MMGRLLSLILGCACAVAAQAQAPAVAEDLLRHSDAVVRLCTVDFVYSSPVSATAGYVEEITVLKGSAAEKGNFSCYVDPTRTLKSFSGTIRDAQGKTVRKLKRSELRYSEFSAQSLASDGAVYYLEVHSPSYPYTVRYEYEIGYKNGLLTFPAFAPVGWSGVSLEKGVYTVSVPAGLQFGYKGANIGDPVKTTADGRDVYRWTLENFPAVKPEPAAPPSVDLVPVVLAAPYDFEYGKTRGSMCDWASYGVWQCGLLEGRDVLPDALKQEVHRRTDALPTPREKVRALYDYLGESTRYVSIQLGIGGQQPMSAAEVFKTKFGDCKALSNYLGAMLHECGIGSHYVIIHTDRRRMYPDFASPAQANHAILCVPLEDETLWLECTNTDVPFGYVHKDIAGHDAVLFRNGTGEFVTLPQYADTLNRMVRRVEVTLAADGSATGHVAECYAVGQYESLMSFPKKDAKKQADLLLGDLKIPLIRVENIACEEVKEALPSITVTYDIASEKYVTSTGSRCFLAQTPFRDASQYRDKERLYDIYRAVGYEDITTVEIRLPANMHVETRPRPCSVTTPFGTYSLRMEVQDKVITIEQRTCMHAGTYSRDLFEEYRDFISGRAKIFNANIVLKKE